MPVEYAQHQKDAIAFQQVQPYSICAYATGTGKSVTTIGSELVNLQQGKLDKCIFVCTKGSIGEVLNDYNKFYSFQPCRLDSSESTYSFFSGSSNVAVTRYEWLKHFDEDLMRRVTKDCRLGMWWDEAQRMKNGSRDKEQVSGTKTHLQGKALRQYCSAYHLVTATPVMTTLDDLWSLMHLVEPKALGTYQQFQNNFYVRELVPHPTVARRKKKCPTCGSRMFYLNGWDFCPNVYCKAIETPDGYLPYQKRVKSIWNLVEYKNLEILSQMMRKHMICYFPDQDIHYIDHAFDMSEKTEVQYTLIAKDVIQRDEQGLPTPFSTRLIELQYLVNKSLEKRQELWKVAQQLKHKGFVLYVSFYESLDAVKEVLDNVPDLEYKTYTGKDCDEDRDTNKKWFQNDPSNKCLIISKAGGASLNLQVTNEFVFYDIPDGFGAMSQALGRVVRLFSSFKTFNIHFILANHSVDTYKKTCFLMYETVMKRLMNNKLISTDKPIDYNTQMKAEMRKDLLWRQ